MCSAKTNPLWVGVGTAAGRFSGVQPVAANATTATTKSQRRMATPPEAGMGALRIRTPLQAGRAATLARSWGSPVMRPADSSRMRMPRSYSGSPRRAPPPGAPHRTAHASRCPARTGGQQPRARRS